MPKKKAAEKKAPAAKKTTAPKQGFIFGEADMILNALETEKSMLKKELDKCGKSIDRLEKKNTAIWDRLSKLEEAIVVARKHAPLAGDPSPPKKEKGTEAPPPGTVVKKEENKGLFREALGPTVPELVKPGDIINTSWGSGPFRIEEVQGPFNKARIPMGEGEPPEKIETPDYYTLKCSDVDAPRTKAGKLKKPDDLRTISYLIGVSMSLVNIFTASEDMITLALPKGDSGDSFKKVAAAKEEKGYF